MLYFFYSISKNQKRIFKAQKVSFITTKAFFQHRFLLFILLLFLRQWWKGKPDRTKVEQKEKIRKLKKLLHYLDFTGLIIETSIIVIHYISLVNNKVILSLQKALNCRY